MFTNSFQTANHKKIIHGVQQLYIIGIVTIIYLWQNSHIKTFFVLGLFDIIPISKTLHILKEYLPNALFKKLNKYVSSSNDNLRSTINWTQYKNALDKKDTSNCAIQLQNMLKEVQLSNNNVKTFHLSSNISSKYCMEPTHQRTTLMIYEFLIYIYQRNIIASLIKYILLKDILHKLSTSLLTNTHKGIFSLMLKRLNEIVFECVLCAFNGSNYDNYMISNSLIIILTKLKQNIHIFKKGASISTIKISIKNNLKRLRNILETSKNTTNVINFNKKNTADLWPLNLFIKDIRNLVASNMSLDKIGKLFNLSVSKLCFPYEKATSIRALKTITYLHPYDEKFWQDTFSSKKVPLEQRIHAQDIFTKEGFTNLYEYSNYYLIQDCVLLHSIVLTLFRNYLNDSINIFIRRNYSQSNLAYQQFLIIEPSRQIDQVLAPRKITNVFYNYFIKLAVTGGLCTCFVHGKVDSNTIINEHFNFIENPNLDKNKWPNFANLNPWTKQFIENPIGISTIDIRSLYPSATVKKLPVGVPLFFTRCIQSDSQQLQQSTGSTLHVKSFCDNVRAHGNIKTDRFRLVNKPPRFSNEYNALNIYLRKLSPDVNIIRFQSSFTALGQLYFGEFPVDGFLVYKKPNNMMLYIKIIQYQSYYYHGHYSSCHIQNNDKQKEQQAKTNSVKSQIIKLYNHYINHFKLNLVNFEYVELYDCFFSEHKIPQILNFTVPYKKTYSYTNFLDEILNNKLTGFIAVRNLEIKKDNQNPIFGFFIQKVQYDLNKLSKYTQDLLTHFKPSPRVISLHKTSSYMVISTDYFLMLYNMFGFETTPDIYHGLFFQMEPYLKNHIELKLKARKDLKELIKHEKHPETKQNYEIKAELIKLMLNSCYGFTLCNLTSSKFKSFKNAHNVPKHKARRKNVKSCLKIANNCYLLEMNKISQEPFSTMLGHIGCSILFHSKRILLKRLNFMIKYLNPVKAQLLYMDTDSAHFLVKHKKFEDNVDENLRNDFKKLFNKHFETGEKLSGIWVQEGFYNSAQYIGEKSYILYDTDKNTHLSHMKGLNTFFQKQFCDNNINPKEYTNISYNIFFKSPDFAIYKIYMNKNLFSNYIPTKRYFISATGSLPLKV